MVKLSQLSSRQIEKEGNSVGMGGADVDTAP